MALDAGLAPSEAARLFRLDISQTFAKNEQALHLIGARSWETVVTAVGTASATVTAAESRACFADAGFPVAEQCFCTPL